MFTEQYAFSVIVSPYENANDEGWSKGFSRSFNRQAAKYNQIGTN